MSQFNYYGENRLSLKDMLNSFCEKGLPQVERQKLIQSKDGQQEIPATFAEIAKCILCGYFSVESGESDVKIIPTAIEFYYHEHIGSALGIERPVKLPLAVVVTKKGAEGLVEGCGHYFLLSGVMR